MFEHILDFTIIIFRPYRESVNKKITVADTNQKIPPQYPPTVSTFAYLIRTFINRKEISPGVFMFC
jgi:hypothetical protein